MLMTTKGVHKGQIASWKLRPSNYWPVDLKWQYNMQWREIKTMNDYNVYNDMLTVLRNWTWRFFKNILKQQTVGWFSKFENCWYWFFKFVIIMVFHTHFSIFSQTKLSFKIILNSINKQSVVFFMVFNGDKHFTYTWQKLLHWFVKITIYFIL